MKNFDLISLEKYIQDGLISKQKHPLWDLWVYNYTQECVFKKKWDDITTQCRGLILDKNGTVVARPFEKFFNYEEQEVPLPEGVPSIYKKMDGSLIIATSWEKHLIVATRGSFISDQARLAEKIILNNDALLYMVNHSDNFTYLFELVGPSNRVVCTYGTDKLILLAAISTWSGLEHNLNYYRHYDFIEVVEEYKIDWNESSIEKLKSLNLQNEEGFVLKWENGFRLKVKFDDYIRLHRLLTGLNERVLWGYLKERKNIQDLKKNVPEEFIQWVDNVVFDMQVKFDTIFKDCYFFIKNNNLKEINRKEAACIILENKKRYQAVLFSMIDEDKEKVRENIYKLIKPNSTKTFTEECKNE
jgi:RNA ligase